MIDHRPTPERVVTLRLSTDSRRRVHDLSSLEELNRLVSAAGGEVAESILQTRASIDPKTFIGSGKVEELLELRDTAGAQALVLDNPISSSQQRNLENRLGLRVLDRTAVILQIFAMRARTKPAMVQVELAQQEYNLTRLTRLWTHLSRIKGGIGFRGPGERQLEVDRREIRRRISRLKQQLSQLESATFQRRKRRDQMFKVAMVGYTNAGKSSLLHALTGEETLIADKVFATLDTTVRRWDLGEGQVVLLSDTVGFIRDLPTFLVEGFKSTLIEALDADLILHVVDGSDPDAVSQIDAVDGILADLKLTDVPQILVMNKSDRDGFRADPPGTQNEHTVITVSCADRTNLDALSRAVRRVRREARNGNHALMKQLPLTASIHVEPVLDSDSRTLQD